MQVFVKLQDEELDVLMRYPNDPETTDSSFQGLLEKLRSQVNPESGELSLSQEDLQKIHNYVSEANEESEAESLLQLFGRISEQHVAS